MGVREVLGYRAMLQHQKNIKCNQSYAYIHACTAFGERFCLIYGRKNFFNNVNFPRKKFNYAYSLSWHYKINNFMLYMLKYVETKF